MIGNIPPPPPVPGSVAPPPLPGAVAGEVGGIAPPPIPRVESQLPLPPAPPPPPDVPPAASTVGPVGGAGQAGVSGAAESELRAQLEGLRREVRSGRRRSLWLGNAAAAALLVGVAFWAAYYATSVLSYAQLDPAIQILRDPVDADRLALVYRPLSRGTIGFRRADVDRETELLDQVVPEAVGKPQTFQWRAAGMKPGDTIRVTFRRNFKLVSQSMIVPGRTDRAGSGKATLVGQVVNAINNQPVAGAEVRVAGTPLSARCDAQGAFRLEGVPSGPVTIEVSKAGFSKELVQHDLAPAQDNTLRIVLNPGMEAGQMRLVLTWDRQPPDLDAHLEGPLPDGQRFHVYYHQQGDLKSKEFVRLDVDDQDGEGPETITVLGVLPGTYRYYVHDYTNRNNPASTALAQSGAEVRVYQGGQTFRYRAGHQRPGNVWNVCTIEVGPAGAVVKKVDTYEGARMAALGLYAKRTMANRLEWLPKFGGTPESEKAVDLGLAWLARHQAEDGSWGPYCLANDPRTRCEAGSRCDGPGGMFEMAHSGLALLAFQAGGHYYFNNNLYSNHVRKGLDWVVDHQRPDGGLVGSHNHGRRREFHRTYMYEHGIATFALGEACAVGGPDDHRYPRYQEALRKAVDFIYQMQHHDGGWRYNDRLNEQSDASVTGWQVLALKTAKEAGIALDPQRIQKVREFFDSRATGENGRTNYLPGALHTEATTGVGMLAKQFLLGEPDAPLVRDASRYLADYAERTWPNRAASDYRDYYLWYNCTLAMFQAGGEPWKRWNDVVRDTIIGLQRRDGCARGSWDPNERWGSEGGRIYTTALAVLTLEVYYRYTSPTENAVSSMPELTVAKPVATPSAAQLVDLSAREGSASKPGDEAVLEPTGTKKGGELNARQETTPKASRPRRAKRPEKSR